MRRIPISICVSLMTCAFLCHASVVRAQASEKVLTSEAPVLSMNIEYRHVPHYFDPRYARIAAVVDQGRCDVLLLDKTTKREAFYSTSKDRVAIRAANGADAYATPIDFASSSTVDSHHLFLICFHDQFGLEVAWQFVVGKIVPHTSPEVISHTDNSGVTLLYAPRRAPGRAGTMLIIAGREYLPESTQFDDAPAAFYATDMTVGQILPGTDLWNAGSSPADVVQTARWNLGGDGGRQRVLAVEQLSGRGATVVQIDPDDPDAPQVVLNVVRVEDTYGLSSLSFRTHLNTLWVFFGPVLPLPARQRDDKTTVTFTIAENEQANIANGELQVQRVIDAERVLWHFDTPNLARGATLKTGVNLMPSAREQANCVNGDCPEPR